MIKLLTISFFNQAKIKASLITVFLISESLTNLCVAQVTNLKVVTDASPDYSDMPGLVHSITDSWYTDKEKMQVLFYWHHIARRQTTPVKLYGVEVTDPIRQYNDYGYTMCSTISGISAGIWSFMGYKSRYFEIDRHTVCEVWYNGRWHEYDNSKMAMYTLCDGKTIAGVQDIGAIGVCKVSDGRIEQGHIAKYHCLNGTSKNGWLEGSDRARTLQFEAESYHPNNLRLQYFYKDADYGHRYILNLRPGETYIRYYQKLGDTNDYFVGPKDFETVNPRYRIRGNGIRTWEPVLTRGEIAQSVYSMRNVRALDTEGIEAIGDSASVVFKVEGSNVMTALDIEATVSSQSIICVSSNNGMDWKPIYRNTSESDTAAKIHVNEEVNGYDDVLIKVQLPVKGKLSGLHFTAITQVNSKTQPRLNIGKNTVYVGVGMPTESIVIHPDLRDGEITRYKVEANNMNSLIQTDERYATMYLKDAAVPEGFVIFKVDAPSDITQITYGGRFCNRAPKSRITLFHSFDNGETWKRSWQLTDTKPPWDTVHYETISNIPIHTRSVLFKYHLFSYEGSPAMCGIYSTRMEVNHKVAEPGFKPLDITFNWSERQSDYSLVNRSHTQRVDKVPFTYTINVGGRDHPIVNSLQLSYKSPGWKLKQGYSDGKDINALKWVGSWVTYGNNLAEEKSYKISVPSLTKWGAGDKNGKKLTDGVVGSGYTGSYAIGKSFEPGALWPENSNPEITVDLGSVKKCAAFRIHLHGYPDQDAIKGEFKDKVEILTSVDGQLYSSRGFFDFNLRWKDIPQNFMWNDEETFKAHNFLKKLNQPIPTRYVKFRIASERMVAVTEVQVLDKVKFEPYDLRITLPNR